jgi:hypothetical protein
MKTTGSLTLAQAEIPVRFAALQAQIIERANRAGYGVVARAPAPAQLAGVQTERQLEALVLTCTRPLRPA